MCVGCLLGAVLLGYLLINLISVDRFVQEKGLFFYIVLIKSYMETKQHVPFKSLPPTVQRLNRI